MPPAAREKVCSWLKKTHLRASHLRVEERLEKAHRADKYSEGLQRRFGPAHEISGVRGGISSLAALPIGPVGHATDSRLFKKVQMRGAHGRDRVRERDREIHTSTNTLHEHEFERGDQRTLRQCSGQSGYGPFSTACSPFFIYSVPLVLPHQTLLMTQALRTSAATMFRR